MHYELRIDPDTHVRASLREDRSTKCVDYPNNYEYEYAFLLHARPRVSTRGQVHQMCGLPPNNYELCIMNYELIQRLYSIYVFTSSATHFA